MIVAAAALLILWIIFKSIPPASPQFAGFAEGSGFCVENPDPKPWERFLLFKKGGGSAPSPDPQIGKAALAQAETGQEWLDFAKEQFDIGNKRQEDTDALNKRVIEQQLGIADQQNDWAMADRDRYEKVFQPIEDEFIEQATNYDTPEKQAEAAAEARADVISSAQGAKAQNMRQMEAMGVNPNSGRFAGISRAGDLDTALAAAGAQNNARTQVRDKGLALKADVANLGRGLPAQSAQATSLGLGAGSSAAGINQQGNNNFFQNQQGMNQGFAGQMKGYAGQAGTLNNLYNSQLQAWSIQQQANAASSSGLFGGIGSLLGTGIGAYAAFSSKKVKEDKQPVEGALDAVESMPVEKWKYKDGVADGGEHVGPYAEDFQKATGLGDGKSIDLISAVGLGLKATQELSAKVDKLAAGKKPKAKRKAKTEA